MGFVYFALLLGVLVFVHELGHFLAARAVGVRVLKFSIGFGPRIIGFTFRGTEYMISLLPLGGYVKFFGDDPDDPPKNEQERKQGFLTTDVWRKSLIVLCGPLANLALPFLIYFPMQLAATSLPPSHLGTVIPESAAWNAGLRSGDMVTHLDGAPVQYWWEMSRHILASPSVPVAVSVLRDTQPLTVEMTPDSVEVATLREIGLVKEEGRAGISLLQTQPVLGVEEGSHAFLAGLLDQDALLAINQRPIHSFEEASIALTAASHRPITVTVARPIPDSDILGPPTDILLGPIAPGEELGISNASFRILTVEEDSTAQRVGILPGDYILALDGKPLMHWEFFRENILRDLGSTHQLTLLRGHQLVNITMSLEDPRWTPGSNIPRYQPLGITVPRATIDWPEIPNNRHFAYAWYQASSLMSKLVVSTAAGFWGLISGQLSIKEMGGPIMIYDIAATTAKQGILSFIQAMMWLSVSLGILNLLPIPVLDGGHLMIFAWEAIRRQDISMRVRQALSMAGVLFLLFLMVVVFFNDIQRKWGGFGS